MASSTGTRLRRRVALPRMRRSDSRWTSTCSSSPYRITFEWVTWPECPGHKGQSQAGPKGHQPEVKAPKTFSYLICVVLEPFSLCYQPTYSKKQLRHTVPLPKHFVASKIDKDMHKVHPLKTKQIFLSYLFIYIQQRFMISSPDLHLQ